MTIVRVKRVTRNIPTGVASRPEGPQATGFRLIPRGEDACEEAPMNAAPSALLLDVAELCEKSNNISSQMGRIMNLPVGEFSRDMAIGLYQRIAVLRASSLVLSGKLEENDVDDAEAMSAIADIAAQSKQMLKDLEGRLQAG